MSSHPPRFPAGPAGPLSYRRFVALSFALAAAAAVPAAAAERRPVTLDDIERVQDVGRPAISPDGRHVAFTLDGRIHVVPRAGGEPRPLTIPGSDASAPRWSRDGKFLYFASDRSGSRQLWKLPVATFGEALPVTDVEGGVGAFRFSPDERYLLLTFDDENRPGSRPPDDEESEDEEPGPFVIDRLQFKEDAGQGYLTARPSDHLYLYDLTTRELRQLTRGEYSESEAEFSPDGRTIVFVSNRQGDPDASYRTDLWAVAVDGRAAPRRLTHGDDVKSRPQWSPDGRWIAYVTAVDGVYGIERLAVIPAAGGEPRVLTGPLDRWVRDFRFSPDGKWIWFAFDNHGARHLARVRLADGRIESMVEGDRVISAFDIDGSGNVVVRANGANDASDLYRVRRGDLERLTNVNAGWFDSVLLGRKSHVSFESEDGTVVEAFITTPPDYVEGRRYPTVLKIHGGPVGQVEWGYDFGTQYLAAAGYVVVEPNPRGSTGRGQDFVNAIYRLWGITDYADVIAAVDYAVEAGIADPERLAVTGYSYGGYMTNVVITRTDRFKAAVSGAGHSFIAANFGHDIYQRWYRWELGTPWENRELYDRLSPILHADKVVTPTLFIGGRVDWNVPILNAELFYQALKTRGIDTRLVVYPGAHHGGWDTRFEKDYLERLVDWFDRHVRGVSTAARADRRADAAVARVAVDRRVRDAAMAARSDPGTGSP